MATPPDIKVATPPDIKVAPPPDIKVAPPHNLKMVARDKTLCVEGLAHGSSYIVTLRQGLPGAGGNRLAETETRLVAIPNRAPGLAFRSAGYILPQVGAEGLQLRSINVESAKLRVLHMADRSLMEKIYAGRVGQTLSDWDIGEMVEKAGKTVWSGQLPITSSRNAPIVTRFPIETVLGDLDRGVYLAIAEAASDTGTGASIKGTNDRNAKASQWFVVSDLGLTSFAGDDGLTVFARSLTGGGPVTGVELHLLGRNGIELAKLITGADGVAHFESDLARKEGDDSAQALFAYGAGGDFSFLDLAAPGIDLSDRSGSVRTSPGPLDAYVYADRGIYRAGEIVNATALLRNTDVMAVRGRRLTLKLIRPDGFEVERHELSDAGAGSFSGGFTLPTTAIKGSWSITAHLETEGPTIGRIEFTVLDFTPPRLEFSLTASQSDLREGKDKDAATLSVDSHYLFGAPAANLPGELSLTLRPAETPFPNYNGFHFGLAQQKVETVQVELPGLTTSPDGKAVVVMPALKLPESSRPLEALIHCSILDIGGRVVSRDLVLPVRHQPFAIGVRARFDDGAVPEGATAGFDVITVGNDGRTIASSNLSYELYEEESDYRWFEADGRWDYETVIHDRRITGGSVSVSATAPATVEVPVKAGRYRFELFDTKTGVATSIRFAAGWWVTPTASSRPDKVEVSVMLPRYRGGEVARVHIRPPYDSQVLVVVADRSVRKTIIKQIDAKGAFLDIPVDPSWICGVSIIATANTIANTAAKTGDITPPRRAIGIGWLAIDPTQRTLEVKLDAPPKSEPRRPLLVGVSVREAGGTALPPDSSAFITLAAVDDTVLQLTDQASPDPAAYYLNQRRLGINLRDVYGRLLGLGGDGKAATRSGQLDKDKRRLHQVPSLPERDQPVVSLFSGIVRIGSDGRAQIPFTLPEFNGKLRLTAVAWTDTKLGHADTSVNVSDRIGTELNLPRFLAPGDHAAVELSLVNNAGSAGDYQVTLQASGSLSLANGSFTIAVPKRGHRTTISRQLVGEKAGTGTIRLEITGADGFHLVRSRTLAVRAPEYPVWRHSISTLTADQPMMAPLDLTDGLIPETVVAALTINPLPGLALPGLALPGLALTADRPLRGSGERLASGVLRLLATSDVITSLDLESATALHDRIQEGLETLRSLQRADGGFALWSPKTDADPWLSAYIIDVLERARSAGFQVPETTLQIGRDWLKKMLDNGWFEDRDLVSRAYATYILARAKLLDAAAVRYFQDSFEAKLQTDLARAQIAAALAALGEGRRAAELFEHLSDAIINHKGVSRTTAGGLRDYGSDLRDLAGILALACESGASNGDHPQALTRLLINNIAGPEQQLGSQEGAWLALAAQAAALTTSRNLALPPGPPAKLAEGDQLADLTRPLYRRFDPAHPPSLHNAGTKPLTQVITVTGLPTASPATPTKPASSKRGFAVSRAMFNMNGLPIISGAESGALRLNEVVVVIIEGHSPEHGPDYRGRHQVVLTDLLPAGLEIESVRLADSPQLG
ncbi:MAG: MG2 domain-containing protein, partial [Rhodospirillaceae bacterium]